MMAMYDMESGARVMEPEQECAGGVQTVSNLPTNPLPTLALRLMTVEESLARSPTVRPVWPQT